MKFPQVQDSISSKKSKALSMKFAILIGIVSLLADMAYEITTPTAEPSHFSV